MPFVRVTRMRLKPGADEILIQAAVDYIDKHRRDGSEFRGELFLVSPDRREAIALTFWRDWRSVDPAIVEEVVRQNMGPYATLLEEPFEFSSYEVAVNAFTDWVLPVSAKQE